MDLKNRLQEALDQLLASKEADAFVVLEDEFSGKYLQFAGSSEQPLLLDLPTQALDGEEIDRARALFGHYGVRLAQWPTMDGPEGRITGFQSGYLMELGRDAAKGAEVAVRIFFEVYRLPEGFSLHVQRGEGGAPGTDMQ